MHMNQADSFSHAHSHLRSQISWLISQPASPFAPSFLVGYHLNGCVFVQATPFWMASKGSHEENQSFFGSPKQTHPDPKKLQPEGTAANCHVIQKAPHGLTGKPEAMSLAKGWRAAFRMQLAPTLNQPKHTLKPTPNPAP